MGQASREIEFKWTVFRPSQFNLFLRTLRKLRLKITKQKVLDITDYYVKDKAGQLKKQGKRCRIRRTGSSWEWTSKSSSTLKQGLASRREEIKKMKSQKNLEGALRYAKKFSNQSPLEVIFTIKNHRVIYQIYSRDRLQAEASLDQVRIIRGKLRDFKKLTQLITKYSNLKSAKKSKVATAFQKLKL